MKSTHHFSHMSFHERSASGEPPTSYPSRMTSAASNHTGSSVESFAQYGFLGLLYWRTGAHLDPSTASMMAIASAANRAERAKGGESTRAP